MPSRVAIGVVSSAAEQPLDIGELELHVSRPAVIALAGIGRRLHLTQECIHLFRLEAAARAHRAVAGHGRRDVHEAALEPRSEGVSRTATAPGPNGSMVSP